MRILLKSVQILNKQSPLHRKKKSVLIENGKIKKISDKPVKAEKIIEGKNLKLTLGWFDLRASFCDPGYEHKEDLASGSQAAAAGGFTEVALLPNTNPVIETKNDISYLNSASQRTLVQIHPLGAVTLGTEGNDLTEMLDLRQAGAVAFTDGENPIWNTDILLKALLYLKKDKALLMNKPEDKMLTSFGVMNEGKNSTILGMKGIPGLAEELTIARDLKILNYAGGKLHFSTVSTAESIDLIRKSKRQGLQVTCDVAAHQLAFDDSFLNDFDTNYKVNPPFRTIKDNQALIKGLNDGTIDAIVSDHQPQDEESKKLEFDLAEFGIIGLQTVLPVLNNLKDVLPMENWIEKLTTAPRNLLGLEVPQIKEGATANLTVFDPDMEWTLNDKTNFSKSNNSPFLEKPLKGRVAAVFNQGKHLILD